MVFENLRCPFQGNYSKPGDFAAYAMKLDVDFFVCIGSGGWITRRRRNYSKNICISVGYGETWTQVETGGRVG